MMILSSGCPGCGGSGKWCSGCGDWSPCNGWLPWCGGSGCSLCVVVVGLAVVVVEVVVGLVVVGAMVVVVVVVLVVVVVGKLTRYAWKSMISSDVGGAGSYI